MLLMLLCKEVGHSVQRMAVDSLQSSGANVHGDGSTSRDGGCEDDQAADSHERKKGPSGGNDKAASFKRKTCRKVESLARSSRI